MLGWRRLHRRFLNPVSSLLQSSRYDLTTPLSLPSDSSAIPGKGVSRNPAPGAAASNGWCLRAMSTERGRSMRSKVESRMRRESGKTLREIRRARKLQRKLMTDEERLLYNLRRAKKKVALLLQKLKKYELPELPPSRHDPELLTPEQLQAYKKIGFRNKNYCPVGVRGVFGGIVQNMHLHWKFHETVQVCCDNFPKEKIKEMATILARLSGGIVINIHNVKTIIMFRGRNYRQPANLIPFNTLTKRKALFKARFEQALESQKLNIKKIEQQLRCMGVNPDDPIAMASIHRVASTFFNAIDQKEGSPFVFHEKKQPVPGPSDILKSPEPSTDSDQEELDKFIADIEDAADKEFAAEEEADEEEFSRIRYLNRDHNSGMYRRSEMPRNDDDSDEDIRASRPWNDRDIHRRPREAIGDDGEDNGISEGENAWDPNDVADLGDLESEVDNSYRPGDKFNVSGGVRRGQDQFHGSNRNGSFIGMPDSKFRGRLKKEDSEFVKEGDPGESRARSYNYQSSSDDEETLYCKKGDEERNINIDRENDLASEADDSDEEHIVMSDSEFVKEGDPGESRARTYNYQSGSDDEEENLYCKKGDEERNINIDWENDVACEADDSNEELNLSGGVRRGQDQFHGSNRNGSFIGMPDSKFRGRLKKEDSEFVKEGDPGESRARSYNYQNGSDDEEENLYCEKGDEERNINIDWENDLASEADDSDEDFASKVIAKGKDDWMGRANNDNGGLKNTEPKFMPPVRSVSAHSSSDHDMATWGSDAEDNDLEAYKGAAAYDYRSSDEEDAVMKSNDSVSTTKKPKTAKQMDEEWDSD